MYTSKTCHSFTVQAEAVTRTSCWWHQQYNRQIATAEESLRGLSADRVTSRGETLGTTSKYLHVLPGTGRRWAGQRRWVSSHGHGVAGHWVERVALDTVKLNGHGVAGHWVERVALDTVKLNGHGVAGHWVERVALDTVKLNGHGVAGLRLERVALDTVKLNVHGVAGHWVGEGSTRYS